MTHIDIYRWLIVLAATILFAVGFYYYDKALRKTDTPDNRKKTETLLIAILSACAVVVALTSGKYEAQSIVFACIIWGPVLAIQKHIQK